MRVLVQHPRGRAIAVAVAVAALRHPAAAQQTDVQADGTFNVGFTQTTRTAFVGDPNAQPADVPADSVSAAFAEIRPGLTLQSGSPRLLWRAGYLFSGMLSITGDQGASYSNQLTGSLAALVNKLTTMTVAANVAQGGTSFLLSQAPAEAGQPAIRAPGNPNLVSGSLAETLSWQIGRYLTFQQNLVAGISAPQDAFSDRSSTLAASIALDRGFTTDALGLELRAAISALRPLRADLEPYMSFTNAVLARWNHDYSPAWNSQVSAGLEQVYTDTGSRPLAFLPTGSVVVRYVYKDIGAAIDYTHGTATNLQVGSISLTDRVTGRGTLVLDARQARTLSFSAGFLHNEPLGQVAALVAAGTGNALQIDAGVSTRLAKNVLGSARYSLAYQFGQDGGLPSTLSHILFVGITASLRNNERPVRPIPTLGRRVDGLDGEGFPVIEDTPTDDTAPR